MISAVDGQCIDQVYVVTSLQDRTQCADDDVVGSAVAGDCCAVDYPDMVCQTGWFAKALAATDSNSCANPGEIAFTCQQIDTSSAASPTHSDTFYGPSALNSVIDNSAFNTGGQLIAGHKVTAVTNAQCLYSLWMCACWANQADGCLCAFENPEQKSVTIEKPTMGKCRPGASKLTDTRADGDGVGHAKLGAGGLALRCSPNPC